MQGLVGLLLKGGGRAAFFILQAPDIESLTKSGRDSMSAGFQLNVRQAWAALKPPRQWLQQPPHTCAFGQAGASLFLD